MNEIKIVIVKEEKCPYCGAYWGHPNKQLDYPNRPKIADEYGWWWKCYNPKCPVAFYNPEKQLVEIKGKILTYQQLAILKIKNP